MITTDDDELADRIAVYRLHGLSKHAWQRYSSKKLMLSDAILPGFKYNMPDLIASLGLHQLKKQERFLEIREQYARQFDEAFGHLPGVRLQPRPRDLNQNRHALHLYVLILDPNQFKVDRNQILSALLAENIGAALHYRAVHTHPFYRDTFGYKYEDFPIAAEVGENILTLPLTPGMSSRDLDDVIAAVHKVLGAYRD
jgi:dTDP-4-amino-4,6-dideoxygalactose transaminase